MVKLTKMRPQSRSGLIKLGISLMNGRAVVAKTKAYHCFTTGTFSASSPPQVLHVPSHMVLTSPRVTLDHTPRRAIEGCGSCLQEPTNESDVVVIVIEFVVVVVVDSLQGLQVELVSEQAPDATEALDELGTLLGPVRDKLEVGAKILVLLSKPFQQRRRFFRLFHFLACRLVRELLPVLLLILVCVQDNLLWE